MCVLFSSSVLVMVCTVQLLCRYSVHGCMHESARCFCVAYRCIQSCTTAFFSPFLLAAAVKIVGSTATFFCTVVMFQV